MELWALGPKAAVIVALLHFIPNHQYCGCGSGQILTFLDQDPDPWLQSLHTVYVTCLSYYELGECSASRSIHLVKAKI
jgi:hypothetical protein